DHDKGGSGAKSSLRYGWILDGGRVERDRELILRVRQPQLSLARQIEARINQRFQSISDRTKSSGSGPGIAEAKDDGIVFVYVPGSYKGDWEHFPGVMRLLSRRTTADLAGKKAKGLASPAVGRAR